MESPERPGRIEQGRKVDTYALLGRGSGQAPRFEPDAVRFDSASLAVETAVDFVGDEPLHRFAAVLTGEFQGEDIGVVNRWIQDVARFAQPGQVVVSLATQDLARSSLGPEFAFRVLGTALLNSHGSYSRQTERIFYVEHPSLPERPSRLRNSASPWRSTTFFGRRREVEELGGLIELSRLVTVTGTVGVGKSALLHRFGLDAQERFADGSALVDLSAIDSVALVAPSIVRALETNTLPGEEHLDAIVAHLVDRRFLLILDNVEDFRPEVARIVSEVLARCPEVAVAVGCAGPLRLAGEAKLHLSGLQCGSSSDDWRSLQDTDAVSLFVDRVQLTSPKYRMTERDAADIAAICRRLDGNPWAIELAVAKMETFTPRQILTRLDDRILLFSDPSTHRPERHRSLSLGLNWAVGRLDEAAKRLLNRLSVFDGAFTVDQATEVCSDSSLPAAECEQAFSELLDESFVEPGEPSPSERRFHLTETLRLFARQKLKSTENAAEFESRRDAWCLRLTADASAGLATSDQMLWLERLDAHMDDVRGLVERNCSPGGDVCRAAQLVLNVSQYFVSRHFLIEGYRLACKIVETRGFLECKERARLENFVSIFAGRLGDSAAAREYALRSIATSKERRDRYGAARGRATLGFHFEEEGDYVRAVRHLTRAVREFRAIDAMAPMIRILVSLGALEPELGNLESAQAHLREAEHLLQRYPEPTVQAYLYQNLGNAALKNGELAEAMAYTRRALVSFGELQDLIALCTSYRNAAYELASAGANESAARFVGAHRKLMPHLTQRPHLSHSETFEAFTLRLRSAMGDTEYESNIFLGAESNFEELADLLALNQA